LFCESTAERPEQSAVSVLRQPKNATMVLPATTFNEQENESLNSESLFSQLVLETVERTDTSL